MQVTSLEPNTVQNFAIGVIFQNQGCYIYPKKQIS